MDGCDENVTEHRQQLIGLPDTLVEVLEKHFGETSVAGMRDIEVPVWHWPAR